MMSICGSSESSSAREGAQATRRKGIVPRRGIVGERRELTGETIQSGSGNGLFFFLDGRGMIHHHGHHHAAPIRDEVEKSK